MSPRPRTVSDEAILAAVWRVVSRVGPVSLTLADVGDEVGLAPATLLQRFGSKRGLLLAMARRAADSVDACFAAVRADHRSPLAALIAAASDSASHVSTPEELTNGLAFLQIDLSDPDFHRAALENSRRIRAGYRALLDDAVAAGELVPCDTDALASAIQAVSGGSLLNWAIHRAGPVLAWVLADLDTLLAPYRRTATTAGDARAPRPRRASSSSRPGRTA